jgi:hypothetical protein
MRAIAENAKEGIDLAENHTERLSRYHLYVTRLSTFLKRLPEMDAAVAPLEALKDELDLLVHHHTSDLLRPAAAPRTMTTHADKRLRMIAVACVRLFKQVGVGEEERRERVAKLILARGYRGLQGKFDKDELKNWVSKVESGELPGASEVERLFRTLPTLRAAATVEDATRLSEAMLGRIRFPPLSGAKAKKQRPLA